MRLGAQFLPEDFSTYIESLRTAESVGYDRAWLVDGQMLWQDVYVYLTHGLAATERIAMGPAVTNPFTRHFTVTASVIATLADLHPGRVLLGIGRGDNAVRTLGHDPVPTRELGEVVPMLRELVSGRPIAYRGREVHIRWADESVPIMMPATGPRNLRLAGALADIVMVYVGVHPASVRWAIDHVRAGAEDAGRDPDAVEISLLCAMWVGDDQDEAWAKCRWAPAACANHTAYLTGDLVDDFTLAGSPDKVLSRLRELSELGVDEVSCAYLNGAVDQMKLVGREILPALPPAPV
jgi:alkanesulfonate monooxygenase SsuD/methylene tetrahydromethanopterin reductase-like flavin-dependent oxidoreductase (luciferase family)